MPLDHLRTKLSVPSHLNQVVLGVSWTLSHHTERALISGWKREKLKSQRETRFEPRQQN